MTHSPRTVLSMIVTSAILTGTITACFADPSPECSTEPVRGLAVAVGGHSNGPQPAWPDALRQELTSVTDATVKAVEQGVDGPGVTLVRVDGRPSVACVLRFDASARNDTAREADRAAFTNAVKGQVSQVAAQQPESDPLAALDMAAAAAGPGGTVVLIDSGLQTVAPLNLRQAGLFDADARRVVAALTTADALPDLHDRRVLLSGIGSVAAPQAALSPAQRAHLVDLWTAIVKAAGAESVEVLRTPNTSPMTKTLPPVSPVPVPTPGPLDLGCDSRSVLNDEGPVGFRSDTTTFVNEPSARRALAGLANWLRSNPGATGHIVGTVAHYGPDTTTGLSHARAHRVRAVLVELGVDPRALRATGGGWGPYPSKSAPPDPEFDPLNRRVVIEVRCS